MSWIRRMGRAVKPAKLRRELGEEIDFHLEAKKADLMEVGASEGAARRQARVEFGGEEKWLEASQASKGAGWLRDAIADTRQAWRMMRRRPGFALAAMLSLGLGLGAATAVFGVVDGVMLRGQPYARAQELENVWTMLPPTVQIGTAYSPWARPLFWNFVAAETGAGHVFQALGAYQPATYNLTGQGTPMRLNAVQATAGVWTALGVRPALGRVYTTEEDAPGRGTEVLLSDRIWRTVFHADIGVVGRTVDLNGVATTVVGVMPSGFEFPDAASVPPTFGFTTAADIWTPAALSHGPAIPFENNTLAVMGRLRAGVTAEQAVAAMQLWSARQDARNPQAKGWFELRLGTLQAMATEGLRGPLLLLMLAVGLVVLVACSNVAGLLLSRSLSRRQELALRQALGATRWRLGRQLMVEAMWLAAGGGVAGAMLAAGALAGLKGLMAEALPRVHAAGLDWRVVGFGLLAAVLSGGLCALAPIAGMGRLETQGKGMVGAGARARLRSWLVGVQVALALVLAVGGGLLTRSLGRMLAAGDGFNPTAATTATITLPPDEYATVGQQAAFYAAVRRELGKNAAIEADGVALVAPLDGDTQSNPIVVPGRPNDRAHRYFVNYTNASAGYFAAAGIRVLQGRGILDSDLETSEPVTVVNRALAQAVFPGETAVGKYIRVPVDKVAKRIVGVVEDVKHDRVGEAAAAEMYVPTMQNPWPPMTAMALVVRARSADGGLPAGLRGEVTAAVHAVDPTVPVSDWTPLEGLVARAVGPTRFAQMLLGCFAGLTLVLAAVGLYGVVAYWAEQRRREFGVRVALGAQKGALFRLVMGQGLRPTLRGLAAGWVLALLGARLMERYLYGVGAVDGWTFTLVPLVLGLVAVGACVGPARRAARQDAMVALRLE